MPKGNRYIDPKKKQEYLDWLMMPPGQREPATKIAMAEHLGVSDRTLYYWESEPEFQEKMRSLKLEWGNRWYPDILNRLMDVVQNGPPAQSVAAAKVLLQHIDVKDASKDSPEMEREVIKRMAAVVKELGYDVLEDDD
jgi:hypothetical protein